MNDELKPKMETLLLLYRAVLPESRCIYDQADALAGGGINVQPYNQSELLYSARCHAAWMLENMPVPGFDRRSSAFHRWVGFVQAVLWMAGVYSLDQLRDQTRAAV